MNGKLWLHRRLRRSRVWRSLNHVHRSLFIDLLMQAAWEPSTVVHEGTRYRLEPGQVLISVRDFAEENGVTRTAIRWFFRVAEVQHELSTKPYPRCTVVTFCNWARYQATSDYEQPNFEPNLNPNSNPTHTVGSKETKNLRNQEREFGGRTPDACPDVQVEPGFPQGHVDSVVDNAPNRGCTLFSGGDPSVAASGDENTVLSQAIAIRSDAEALFRGHKPKLARKRKSEGAHPEHERFVESFHALFMNNRRAAPEWGAKQGSWVKQLLTKHGFDECMARAKRMFEMAPKWPAENPTLATLRGHWDSFAPPVAGIRPIGQGRATPLEEYPEPGQDFEF